MRLVTVETKYLNLIPSGTTLAEPKMDSGDLAETKHFDPKLGEMMGVGNIQKQGQEYKSGCSKVKSGTGVR